MRRSLIASFALAGLAPLSAATAQGGERLFYYVDTEAAYRSLVQHIDAITVLGPQVYSVDSLGVVAGSVDARVISLAKAHGVKVMPLVTNEGFNQPELAKLLGDSAALHRATRNLADVCRTNGYWGIQFDIENMSIRDRDRFTAWYGESARALHAVGCKISIAVVPGTSADFAGATSYDRFLQNNWRGGYDLAAIGRISDFVSLMTYSQHTRLTPPGPIAGIRWMRDALDYALTQIPADKLSIGIPTYGGHWLTTSDGTIPEHGRSTSQSVNWTWGSGLAERYGASIQWDEDAQAPFAHFENGGTYEWLYLENARSFAPKLALVSEKKLRGFSVWVLGLEDPKIWDLLPPRTASQSH